MSFCTTKFLLFCFCCFSDVLCTRGLWFFCRWFVLSFYFRLPKFGIDHIVSLSLSFIVLVVVPTYGFVCFQLKNKNFVQSHLECLFVPTKKKQTNFAVSSFIYCTKKKEKIQQCEGICFSLKFGNHFNCNRKYLIQCVQVLQIVKLYEII